MDLLIIFGPPAAGKMTVGRSVAERTRYRLFHNHVTIEPVLTLFEFRDPAFARLVSSFRTQILDECIAHNGFDLVFTYVWDLDEPSEDVFLGNLAGRVAAAGGVTRYAELVCDQTERLRRNRTPLRLQEKPSKRDLAFSEQNLRTLDERNRTTSRPGEMVERLDAPYLRINNTALSAKQVAAQIIDAFNLPSRQA